jgi:hypothetical protein
MTIELSTFSEFLKFDVLLNEIPIKIVAGNREDSEYKN